MSAHSHAPGSTDALRALAEVQLQVQASRSATLDARAMGLMGVNAVMATIVFGARLSATPRAVALAMLATSAGLAARSLFLEGARRVGPSVARLLVSREIHHAASLDESILSRLAADVATNERALTRKMPRLTFAFLLLALAALPALTGLLL